MQSFVFLLLSIIPVVHSMKLCAYVGYRGKAKVNNTKECPPQKGHCAKNYTISYIDIPPYSISEIFEDILKACCENCVNVTVVKRYTNISQIDFTVSFYLFVQHGNKKNRVSDQSEAYINATLQ